MTPEARPSFAEQCAALCPRFRASGPAHRARKSELLAGELDGAPVIAKRLLRPNVVWEWYLAREIAIYRAFAASPPPIRVPRFVAASDDVLVIERLLGAPVAKLRRPRAELTTETVRSMIELHDRLAAWPGRFPDDPSPPRVRSQLRQRLLEDPTAPIEWVRAGIGRCGARGYFGEATQAALDALAGHCPIASSHGDLLLRNAIAMPDREVGLVDWECAGPHVADWDLALLWTQLAPEARGPIDDVVGGGARLRAFLALVAFAFAREIAFLEVYRVAPQHRGMIEVREELTRALGRLADSR